MIMATKRARERARAARLVATAIKRARVRVARGMATATRVAGDKKERWRRRLRGQLRPMATTWAIATAKRVAGGIRRRPLALRLDIGG
jgi:hypothetical protein